MYEYIITNWLYFVDSFFYNLILNIILPTGWAAFSDESWSLVFLYIYIKICELCLSFFLSVSLFVRTRIT